MQENQNEYSPGVSNIGHREISVRKKFFNIFLPVSVILSIAAAWFTASILILLSLFFSVFALLVLHFEIKYRFCVLFGFFKLYNFEKLGNLREVSNTDSAHKDLKKVLEIVIESLLFAIIYTTAVHFLAVYMYQS